MTFCANIFLNENFPEDGHKMWPCGPTRAMFSSFLRFVDHTQRRITVGRTPLDEWSARRRYLYLTTHNTHYRQTSISPVGIRTHDLSRRAAAELCLRPRGYADYCTINLRISLCKCWFISHNVIYALAWWDKLYRRWNSRQYFPRVC